MWYWTAAIILMFVNACCVAANLLMLPGNWIMVGSLCVFILFKSDPGGPGWITLLVVAAVAGLGELLELLAGSATASRQGASRRAMALSLLFSVVASIIGSIFVPPPVIGSAIGAIFGAALGAFAGAWVGEMWKGQDATRSTHVGTAAMTGRILGMVGKIALGIAIFVIQFASLWLSGPAE
ncbi:MAG: DUF456 domain-containing protein [Planctomycetaceae bacterium]|nr:DUF456 domain-containing protein [Planctomycetaceae bacterium]